MLASTDLCLLFFSMEGLVCNDHMGLKKFFRRGSNLENFWVRVHPGVHLQSSSKVSGL